MNQKALCLISPLVLLLGCGVDHNTVSDQSDAGSSGEISSALGGKAGASQGDAGKDSGLGGAVAEDGGASAEGGAGRGGASSGGVSSLGGKVNQGGSSSGGVVTSSGASSRGGAASGGAGIGGAMARGGSGSGGSAQGGSSNLGGANETGGVSQAGAVEPECPAGYPSGPCEVEGQSCRYPQCTPDNGCAYSAVCQSGEWQLMMTNCTCPPSEGGASSGGAANGGESGAGFGGSSNGGAGGIEAGGTGGGQTVCGASICTASQMCCGPVQCGTCIDTDPGSFAPPNCPTSCPAGGAGGAGSICLTDGSGTEWSFPNLDRGCDDAGDCALAIMTINCCGSVMVSAYREDQIAAFTPYADDCRALAQCECALRPPITLDGEQLTSVTDALAECVDGTCTAVAP